MIIACRTSTGNFFTSNAYHTLQTLCFHLAELSFCFFARSTKETTLLKYPWEESLHTRVCKKPADSFLNQCFNYFPILNIPHFKNGFACALASKVTTQNLIQYNCRAHFTLTRIATVKTEFFLYPQKWVRSCLGFKSHHSIYNIL